MLLLLAAFSLEVRDHVPNSMRQPAPPKVDTILKRKKWNMREWGWSFHIKNMCLGLRYYFEVPEQPRI